MTTPDDFRSILSGLDTPVVPDPLFARRLRGRFLAEAQASGSGQVGSSLMPEPRPIRRNRLFDLAAVAMLVLSMIGGMVGLNHGTIGSPTPTVEAAVATPEPPTTSRGSAAQDYQYSGSLPDDLEATPAWTVAAVGGPAPWHQPMAYGNLFYRFHFEIRTQTEAETTYTQPTLQALDADTGTIVWEQPISTRARFVVTDQGVVAQEQVAGNGLYYRLVLLDRLTGERIWESADSFGGPDQPITGYNQVIVDGPTIYMAGGNGAISAGSDHWRDDLELRLSADRRGGAGDPGMCIRGQLHRTTSNGYNPGRIERGSVCERHADWSDSGV